MFWNQKTSKEVNEQVAKMAELSAFEQAIQSQVPFIQFVELTLAWWWSQGEIVNILLKIKNSFLPTKQILIGL